MDFLKQALDDLEAAGLRRTLRRVEGPQGPAVRIDGKEVVCFCSNNYLSLAGRPELADAAARAARDLGCGSGASRLISGNMAIHEELEDAIARFKQRPAALLFPTGYMANIGVITALLEKEDAVIVDHLNHASIIDACRLSGAKLLVYPHRSWSRAAHAIERASRYRRKLLVTDSVFSMDGGIAPLPELSDVCKADDVMLMIDEAHATGVLGDSGLGIEQHFGMPGDADIVMGTLSKAIGSIGGFVAGSRELIDYLRNTARSFIYTTALPPTVVAASLAALKIIETDPGPHCRLWQNVHFMHDLLEDANLSESVKYEDRTPMIPIHIGDAKEAVRLASNLFELGYLCPAIRPPTVPADTSRLRISIQAGHTADQIEGFVQALVDIWDEAGSI